MKDSSIDNPHCETEMEDYDTNLYSETRGGVDYR